MEMNELSK